MKTLFIALAAPILACAPALAEPSQEVRLPADVTSQAQATAYTDALLGAVDSVCRRVANPMVGNDYDVYRACKRSTVRDTAAKDPTGLLAQRLGLTPVVAVASK